MKQLLLLFTSIFLLNCSNQNSEKESQKVTGTTSEPTKEQTELIEKSVPAPVSQLMDSSFDSFLIEFSNNETFQLTRVDFPLNVKIIDIEDKEENISIIKDEWQHSNLLDTAGIETQEYGKYSQTVEVTNSIATVKLRGIDNGIRIDYTFQLREGRWFLTKIFNTST